MFAKACALASGFTRPVVVSSRSVDGACSAVVGACIVVNAAGWVLTAAHIVGLIQEQSRAAQIFRKYRADRREMDRDIASDSRYRKQKLRRFERPQGSAVRDHSVWWGSDGAQLTQVHLLPASDLALGRLAPFDPRSVPRYPAFKIPGAAYAPGRSLCRLGFPFHDIVPTYDEARNAFMLPKGAVPLPLFPLECMFTRTLISPPPGAEPGADSGKFIETSSPGLRGQSGGPLFDVDGAVWGLQSHTRHYPLGFAPKAARSAAVPFEHQFLNAGAAAHGEAILALLEQHGIEHRRVE